MKHLLIASALTMMTLSGAAVADGRDRNRDDRKDYREWQREALKDRREAQREYEKDRREYEKDRREAHREYWKDRAEAEREYAKDRREALREREKAQRRWARGQHIPRDYLYDRYYVRDYRAYNLAPPPNGHMWVRPDAQDVTYYLVQLATGLISGILGE